MIVSQGVSLDQSAGFSGKDHGRALVFHNFTVSDNRVALLSQLDTMTAGLIESASFQDQTGGTEAKHGGGGVVGGVSAAQGDSTLVATLQARVAVVFHTEIFTVQASRVEEGHSGGLVATGAAVCQIYPGVVPGLNSVALIVGGSSPFENG